MLMGEIKLAQQVWILGETVTIFALLAKNADFGVFCACWASFVSSGRWWSRAGRVFSRLWGRGGTGMKEKPPLREVLWGAVKYSSPLHAEKCCILPILSEQGRFIFH